MQIPLCLLSYILSFLFLLLIGHDTYTLSTNIAPDVTTFNITGLNLEENTQYYTVVQAYNKAGLHSIAVSDGFMLDLHAPIPGMVLDGISKKAICILIIFTIKSKISPEQLMSLASIFYPSLLWV